jgi:hypothetical protein
MAKAYPISATDPFGAKRFDRSRAKTPYGYKRLILFAIALSSCASNYYSYSGSPVLTGNGGASKNINGIDLWVVGTPPRQYRVVGYIEDTRLGGPIPMAMRNPQLAAMVRKQGGDALLLSSDNEQIMGSFSTANASATGWGSATTFGNTTTFNGGANAFGTGMTMPIVRRSSRYYVIKYVN